MYRCARAGKVFDRMSKGVREAPGKALIGELAAASGDRPEGAFGEAPASSSWVHSSSSREHAAVVPLQPASHQGA